MYYLTKFWSYSKNFTCNFKQANSCYHKLFHFHLPFWIWKAWKGREKIQKFEYLENKKSFLDEIKKNFHSFWRAIIYWRNKNLIKNSGHKLLAHVLIKLHLPSFFWNIWSQTNRYSNKKVNISTPSRYFPFSSFSVEMK